MATNLNVIKVRDESMVVKLTNEYDETNMMQTPFTLHHYGEINDLTSTNDKTVIDIARNKNNEDLWTNLTGNSSSNKQEHFAHHTKGYYPWEWQREEMSEINLQNREDILAHSDNVNCILEESCKQSSVELDVASRVKPAAPLPIIVTYTENEVEPINWSAELYLSELKKQLNVEMEQECSSKDEVIEREYEQLQEEQKQKTMEYDHTEQTFTLESEIPVERKLEFVGELLASEHERALSQVLSSAMQSHTHQESEVSSNQKYESSEENNYIDVEKKWKNNSCQSDLHGRSKPINRITVRTTRAMELLSSASRHKMLEYEVAKQNVERRKARLLLSSRKVHASSLHKKLYENSKDYNVDNTKGTNSKYIKTICLSSEERELQEHCTFSPSIDRHSNYLMHDISKRQAIPLHHHHNNNTCKTTKNKCELNEVCNRKRKTVSEFSSYCESAKQMLRGQDGSNAGNRKSECTYNSEQSEKEKLQCKCAGVTEWIKEEVDECDDNKNRIANQSNNHKKSAHANLLDLNKHSQVKPIKFGRSHSTPIISCANVSLCKARTINYMNGEFYLTPFRGR